MLRNGANSLLGGRFQPWERLPSRGLLLHALHSHHPWRSRRDAESFSGFFWSTPRRGEAPLPQNDLQRLVGLRRSFGGVGMRKSAYKVVQNVRRLSQKVS